MWPPGPGLVPDSPKLAQQTHLDHSSSDDSTSSWLAYQPTRSPGPDHRLGHHDRLRHTSQGPEVPMAWATKLIENYRRDAGWPAGGPVRVAGSDQAGTVSPRACQAANMEADLKLNLPPAVTVSSMRDTCGWQWAPWIFEKRYFHPLEFSTNHDRVILCLGARAPPAGSARRPARKGLQYHCLPFMIGPFTAGRSDSAFGMLASACQARPVPTVESSSTSTRHMSELLSLTCVCTVLIPRPGPVAGSEYPSWTDNGQTSLKKVSRK